MEWMAWTLPTALFFAAIASLLIIFTVLAIRYPEEPRRGILRIETTRGLPPGTRYSQNAMPHSRARMTPKKVAVGQVQAIHEKSMTAS